MKDKIYEHLKTRKKYNTLELKYDVKCEELERKILELNTEHRVRVKQQDLFNERIQELLEVNLKLKEENTKLKKEVIYIEKGYDCYARGGAFAAFASCLLLLPRRRVGRIHLSRLYLGTRQQLESSHLGNERG